MRFRLISLVTGLLFVLLILAAWVRESTGDWKKYQSRYRQLVIEKSGENAAYYGKETAGTGNKTAGTVENTAGTGEKAAGTSEVNWSIEKTKRIYEVSPEGLNRTDRCITCHRGIEDPSMKDVPQPLTMHPGEHLTHHPVERFGCTVCHGGQGRAIDRIQAFGEDPSTHWNFPLLHPPYIESSCGKCHLGIFAKQEAMEGTSTFEHGKAVFAREGCLGCHQARGVGGIVGPDLTEQGEKTRHEYSFTNVRGEQSVSNWLREHFRDPEMVSPGSRMLQMELPGEELEALVTFTMGLAKPDYSFDYLAIEALEEFRGKRDFLEPAGAYAMICSACHGKDGEGKDYESFETGVPSLGNYDFIRVASLEMIRFTLLHGRGERQMASWLPMYSGLTYEEIDSLSRMLDSRFETNVSFGRVRALRGHPESGKNIFLRDCSICHEENGRGDIGLALNNTDFLSAASDRYLFKTLTGGRNIAGMPAWSRYKATELADLIAYLRTWGGGPSDEPAISLLPGDTIRGDLLYHYLCSRCHGEYGEGNTGPAILTRDFQKLASDAYLYRTISEGRSHTAMFGWSTDVKGAGKLDRQGISDIIAYMRSYSVQERDYIYPGRNPGNAAEGSRLYASVCAECHGKNGEGTKAPALNNQEFLNSVTNGYLLATISIGREGTRMPSWGRGDDQHSALSASQRKDITAHIRSWQRYRIRQ